MVMTYDLMSGLSRPGYELTRTGEESMYARSVPGGMRSVTAGRHGKSDAHLAMRPRHRGFRGVARGETHPNRRRRMTWGAPMDEFTAGVLRRIRDTEQSLKQAFEEGDDYLVEVEQAELDDLLRLASEHGVQILPESA